MYNFIEEKLWFKLFLKISLKVGLWYIYYLMICDYWYVLLMVLLWFLFLRFIISWI